MVSNPSVSLQSVTGGSWAKLIKTGSDETYHFLINPETTSEDHQAAYNPLAVLGTGQPLLKYQTSVSRYSFPDVKLWADGNNKSVRSLIDTLVGWTKPSKDGQQPPTLTFTWGGWELKAVKLVSVSAQVTARMGGEPTEATLSIVLELFPDLPKPITNEEADKAKTLTERERLEETDKLKSKLKTDKKLAEKLKYDPKDTLAVDSKGNVTLKSAKDKKPRAVGNLADLQKDLKPGLSWIKPTKK